MDSVLVDDVNILSAVLVTLSKTFTPNDAFFFHHICRQRRDAKLTSSKWFDGCQSPNVLRGPRKASWDRLYTIFDALCL